MEVHSPYKYITIPVIDLFSSFENTFSQSNKNNTAIVEVWSGRSFTFGDLSHLIELVAKTLQHHGFRKGSRLALCCTNCVDYVIFMAATLRLGGVIVGINHILTKDDIIKQLELSSSEFVFTGYTVADKVLQAVQNSNIKKVYVRGHPVAGSSVVPVESIYASSYDHYPALPNIKDLRIDPQRDPAAILFSSGTTGFPKPVVTSHSNIINITYYLAHPDIEMMSGHIVVYQPMCHIFGMDLAICCLMFAQTLFIMDKFDFEKWIKIASENKIKAIHVAPPVAVRIGKSDFVDKHDMSQIKDVCAGAGAIGAQTEKDVLSRLKAKARFRQVYGLTESSGIVTMTPAAHHPKANVPQGSVGFAAPFTAIKVIDVKTGKLLGPNQEGELWVKGPQNMLGYEGRPEATKEMLDKDGWLHTGDIGHFDKDGFFFITDRLKDLIKYKGYQVAPLDLERSILSHPDVDDAGVFSIPDEETGELPRAWVVRKSNSTLTETQLHAFINERVAAFKKLRGGLKFVDSIPRSASGKVLRRVMKDADTLSSKL